LTDAEELVEELSVLPMADLRRDSYTVAVAVAPRTRLLTALFLVTGECGLRRPPHERLPV
jgi:hypothetical protein